MTYLLILGLWRMGYASIRRWVSWGERRSGEIDQGATGMPVVREGFCCSGLGRWAGLCDRELLRGLLDGRADNREGLRF